MTIATSADLEIDAPLTEKEQADFARLEQVIGEGLTQMEKAGKALIEIRQRKLYRAQFRTFKAYVETKWQKSVREAYHICGVAEVVENLCTNGAQTLPRNGRQFRELEKLPPDVQPAIWKAVTESGEKPTAAAIAKTVVRMIPKPTAPPVIIDVVATATKAQPSLEQHPVPTLSEIETGDAYFVARRLLDLWRVADKSNRSSFLFSVVTSSRRDIKKALDTATRKPAPEKLR